MNAAHTPLAPQDTRAPSQLPAALRGRAQAVFGVDPGSVPIKVDASLAGSPVRARCDGRSLVFAPDAWDPGSEGGDFLIGHELTHLLQLRGAARDFDRDCLEGDADRGGAAFARGQRHQVIGGGLYLHASAPGRTLEYRRVRPQDRAAEGIVLVGRNDRFFPSQVRLPGRNGFLRSNLRTPRIHFKSTESAVLLLSEGGRLAIEEPNRDREIKAAWVEEQLFEDTLLRLDLLGSNYSFVMSPAERLVITDPQSGQVRRLVQVMPLHRPSGTAGLNAMASRDCNGTCSIVSGTSTGGMDAVFNPAADFMTSPPPVPFDEPESTASLMWRFLREARGISKSVAFPVFLGAADRVSIAAKVAPIAKAYGKARRRHGQKFQLAAQQAGINEFCRPEPGEAFGIESMPSVPDQVGFPSETKDQPIFDWSFGDGSPPTPRVYRHGATSGSHWAGVVFRDGDDAITLENYIRVPQQLEDEEKNDPVLRAAAEDLGSDERRWYFGMFGMQPGQSFHHETEIDGARPATPAESVQLTDINGNLLNDPETQAPVRVTHVPVNANGLLFHNATTHRMSQGLNHYERRGDELFAQDDVATALQGHDRVANAASSHEHLREVMRAIWLMTRHKESVTEQMELLWAASLQSERDLANRFPENRRVIDLALEAVREVN